MSEQHVREIGMPRLSDSMEEATVTRWLKRPGDAVARGEELVEVETDKATVVYEAEFAGVLDEILVDEGATAALGAPIARMRTAEAGAPVAAAQPVAAAVAAPAPAAPARQAKEGRSRATPVARRLANDLGVGLDGIAGSGPGGRIVRSDVRAAQPTAATTEAAPAATPMRRRWTRSGRRGPAHHDAADDRGADERVAHARSPSSRWRPSSG